MAAATSYGYGGPAMYGASPAAGVFGGLDMAAPVGSSYDAALQGLPSSYIGAVSSGPSAACSSAAGVRPPGAGLTGMGAYDGEGYRTPGDAVGPCAGLEPLGSSAVPGGGLGAMDGSTGQDPRLDASMAATSAATDADGKAILVSGVPPSYANGATRVTYSSTRLPGTLPENGYRTRFSESPYEPLGAASAAPERSEVRSYSRPPEEVRRYVVSGESGEPMREFVTREYRGDAPVREYIRVREPVGEYRTSASASEYRPQLREYRETSAPPQYREATEYVEVAEAPRDSYNFPTAGSFVAEPYREGGSPLYVPSSRSYPSAAYPERHYRERSSSPMPGRPSSPMYERSYSPSYGGGYGMEGAYSRERGGYGGYGGYRGNAYDTGGYSGNAYDTGGAYARGGGQANGYGYGPASQYSRGDTYSGGTLSYGPPPGGPQRGGGGASYGAGGGYGGMPGGAGYGGLGTSTSLQYNFPTTGSFVAEPFAPGAPTPAQMPRASSYTPPPQYAGGGSYGGEPPTTFGNVSPQYGGAGAASPLPPPNASFLALPDPAASFAGISGANLGAGGGFGAPGGVGACPSFAHAAGAGATGPCPSSSFAAGLGGPGSFGGSPPLGGLGGGTPGLGATGPSALSDAATAASGAGALGPLKGGKSPLDAASNGDRPIASAPAEAGRAERPPYKSPKPAKLEPARSKKSKGRLCC